MSEEISRLEEQSYKIDGDLILDLAREFLKTLFSSDLENIEKSCLTKAQERGFGKGSDAPPLSIDEFIARMGSDCVIGFDINMVEEKMRVILLEYLINYRFHIGVQIVMNGPLMIIGWQG